MSLLAPPARTQTLARLRTVLAPMHSDPADRLPLRTELFLIAHDEKTGRCHLSQRALQRALAGALLLELWLAGRIQIGWRYHVREGNFALDPGRISILNDNPVGDPLLDTTLAMLSRTSLPQVKDILPRLAATGLYERVRGDMIASGLLKRGKRRLFRSERYVPVEPADAVRARARLRGLVAEPRPTVDPNRTDHHGIALAALVTLLGLTPSLYSPDMPTSSLHRRLVDIVDAQRDPAIRDVTTVI